MLVGAFLVAFEQTCCLGVRGRRPQPTTLTTSSRPCPQHGISLLRPPYLAGVAEQRPRPCHRDPSASLPAPSPPPSLTGGWPPASARSQPWSRGAASHPPRHPPSPPARRGCGGSMRQVGPRREPPCCGRCAPAALRGGRGVRGVGRRAVGIVGGQMQGTALARAAVVRPRLYCSSTPGPPQPQLSGPPCTMGVWSAVEAGVEAGGAAAVSIAPSSARAGRGRTTACSMIKFGTKWATLVLSPRMLEHDLSINSLIRFGKKMLFQEFSQKVKNFSFGIAVSVSSA